MNYKFIPLYLIAAATLVFSPLTQAQSSKLRKANKFYENYDYALALEQYNKVAAKRKPDLYVAQHIAACYRQMRHNEEAEKWYGTVVSMAGHDPVNLYYYAEVLRSNGKYKEAKEYYMRWGEELPVMSDRAQEYLKACDIAAFWLNKLPVAEVKPLQELNYANSSDFSPMQFGDGIIFTSDRGAKVNDKKNKTFGWTARPYLQLFSVHKDEQGRWGNPMPLKDAVNSDYHNATASAAQNGQTLYFTRTHMVKRRYGNADPTGWTKEAEVAEYVNRLGIYTAERKEGMWSNIQPFAFNNLNEYSVGHPVLSPDGNVLYFASDMPGGEGQTDIYYTTRQKDGNWGEPVNAGTAINTSGRESFPYIDKNGKLFFASDGHLGMGGLDIFEAEGEHGEWSDVKNMGYPINTPQNDYGIMFTEEEEEGLLSSDRTSEDGTTDIFSFKMLQKPVVLAIATLETKQNTQKRNEQVALPQVRVAVSQQNIPDSTVIWSDTKGEYFMDARKGNAYTFTGYKDGYLKQAAQLQVPATAPDTVQVALLLYKNEVNKAIVLDNIYYDLDKWDIRPDAAKELDKLVRVLKENPTIRIEMGSHTDSRESESYNQQLSERRAQAAVDYLVSKGIDINRLEARGYGKTRLINRCADGVICSEEEHQLNRRTEFKIIK
ncbi:OmpA family protein [Pontibacter silvestris]|uniref:OmpA family protein n=1 Tax=Pontibacter silvestris TaxID=2305183 RepID=A0ABW4X3B4_9BACT|nr:OmpA family protein [Pontibacter silvestris]MCC9135911.1 OmpA family protein [Pontibacter silvestris]